MGSGTLARSPAAAAPGSARRATPPPCRLYAEAPRRARGSASSATVDRHPGRRSSRGPAGARAAMGAHALTGEERRAALGAGDDSRQGPVSSRGAGRSSTLVPGPRGPSRHALSSTGSRRAWPRGSSRGGSRTSRRRCPNQGRVRGRTRRWGCTSTRCRCRGASGRARPWRPGARRAARCSPRRGAGRPPRCRGRARDVRDLGVVGERARDGAAAGHAKTTPQAAMKAIARTSAARVARSASARLFRPRACPTSTLDASEIGDAGEERGADGGERDLVGGDLRGAHLAQHDCERREHAKVLEEEVDAVGHAEGDPSRRAGRARPGRAPTPEDRASREQSDEDDGLDHSVAAVAYALPRTPSAGRPGAVDERPADQPVDHVAGQMKPAMGVRESPMPCRCWTRADWTTVPGAPKVKAARKAAASGMSEASMPSARKKGRGVPQRRARRGRPRRARWRRPPARSGSIDAPCLHPRRARCIPSPRASDRTSPCRAGTRPSSRRRPRRGRSGPGRRRAW